MKLESPQERMESIRTQAENDLRDHQVRELTHGGAARCWHCARPGTGCYSFFITTIPRAVIVAGDIGELIFHPTHPRMEEFIVGGDPQYQHGKLSPEFRHSEEISPYLVREALADVVREHRESGVPLAPGLKDFCRWLRADVYTPESIHDFYRELANYCDDYFDVRITVPDFGVLYRIFALQWFGRWLKRQQEETL